MSLDFSPQFLVLLHFSPIPFRVFFFYVCALIIACACLDWCQLFCTNFHLWCHIPYVLEFLDYWYIPTQTCCTNRFLSSGAGSLVLLLSNLLRLLVSSNRVGDGGRQGKPRLRYVPSTFFPFFYIVVLLS